MRKPNTLKRRLRAGEVVVGMWCTLPSPGVINLIAAAGFDFVIIDLEHGPADFETAEDLVRAAESEGCCPLIRLGQIDEDRIIKSLDIGAHGVLVAHVEEPRDAEEVISLVKYSPLGRRGFSPYTRAGGYGSAGIERHTETENAETLAGVILEAKGGVENLEAIARTPNLDLIYIGAYDLSQALGMPGQVQHPVIRQHLQEGIGKIRAAGLAAGGYVAKGFEDMTWMIDMGMQFITCLPDVTVFHDACAKLVGDFQAARGRQGQQ